MIVLDTNVLSELTRPVAGPRALERVNSLPVLQTAITSATVAEILYGIGECTPATTHSSRMNGYLLSQALDDNRGRDFVDTQEQAHFACP